MKSEIVFRYYGIIKMFCTFSLSIATLFVSFNPNNLTAWGGKYIIPCVTLLVWSFFTTLTSHIQFIEIKNLANDLYGEEISTMYILKMLSPYLFNGWAWIVFSDVFGFRWQDFNNDYKVLSDLFLVWLSLETGFTFLLAGLLCYQKLIFRPVHDQAIEIFNQNLTGIYIDSSTEETDQPVR